MNTSMDGKISAGSSAGSKVGLNQDALKAGDVVEVSLEGVGVLKNTVGKQIK